ncbi:unannotated protein [freshwater metagenome]|uniref:Unannotated protein n=1 Tax=freshwater metagenome TaxID=449393 RepID=A0A6J6G4F8_9ZZZZ
MVGSFTTAPTFSRRKSATTSLAARLMPTSLNTTPTSSSSPLRHATSSISWAVSRGTDSADMVGTAMGTPEFDCLASASYAARSAFNRSRRYCGAGPLNAGME